MKIRVIWNETDALIEVVDAKSLEAATNRVAEEHNLCVDDLSAQFVQDYNREVVSRPWWELERDAGFPTMYDGV